MSDVESRLTEELDVDIFDLVVYFARRERSKTFEDSIDRDDVCLGSLETIVVLKLNFLLVFLDVYCDKRRF